MSGLWRGEVSNPLALSTENDQLSTANVPFPAQPDLSTVLCDLPPTAGGRRRYFALRGVSVGDHDTGRRILSPLRRTQIPAARRDRQLSSLYDDIVSVP